MIRHVVLIELAEDTPTEERIALRDGLRALADLIPEIEHYSVGLDLGIRDANPDIVVIGDFADRAAFDVYMTHPEHLRIGKRVMAAAIATTGAQYDVGADEPLP